MLVKTKGLSEKLRIGLRQARSRAGAVFPQLLNLLKKRIGLHGTIVRLVFRPSHATDYVPCAFTL